MHVFSLALEAVSKQRHHHGLALLQKPPRIGYDNIRRSNYVLTCKSSQLRRKPTDLFLRCDTIRLSLCPRDPPPSEGRGQARPPPEYL